MKLETKYGMLEGTVEEFKELLEEKDLSFFSVKEEEAGKVYKIVNNDNARCALNSGRHVPKGLILEHMFLDGYVDTMGNHYILHDEDLDDYNMSWVEGKFKSFKDKDLLLVQKENYKVVKEDIYSKYGNRTHEKGKVLLETEYNHVDSLGNKYRLNPDTIENKLEGIYGDSVGLRFEEHKLNNKLYKVELP